MAKKAKDSLLVKAATTVGRTLGRGVRGLAAVTGRKKAKKAVKTVAKTPVRTPSKPASSRASRTQATASALNAQHGTAVDERARARSTSGERWAARNKPR